MSRPSIPSSVLSAISELGYRRALVTLAMRAMDKSSVVAAFVLLAGYVGYGEYCHRRDLEPSPNSEGVRLLRSRLAMAEGLVYMYEDNPPTCPDHVENRRSAQVDRRGAGVPPADTLSNAQKKSPGRD